MKKLKPKEEDDEWDKLTEATEYWWYALSDEEKRLLNPITNWTACLCRGEDPEEHWILTCKSTKNGRFKVNYEKEYWELVKKCAVELFNYNENLDERIQEAKNMASELTYHQEPLYKAADFAGVQKIDPEIYDKYLKIKDY